MCVVPSLVFCTRVAWVCLVCLLLCKEEGSSLDAPYICCVFACRKLSPHLGVLKLDHRCLLFLCFFLCVILHTMSSGKSLQLLCIFPFGMLCLSVMSMMFV